ncbi:MAG: hypothetical protein EOL95_10450 [Bacteroidia bacterium]|nr:hypothetical protein [Bacteroidia bacterium]
MADGTPTLTKITIDSVDVTDYLNTWTTTDQNGSDFIQSIAVYLSRDMSDVITLDDTIIGKEIIVQRGVSSATENYVFRGVVVSYSKLSGMVTITGHDKLYLATKRVITYSFDKDIDTEAGVISEIFKTIVNDYTTLTADDDSVQSSGSTLILSKFICKSEKVYTKLKTLAEALGWLFYYNPTDDKVHFEPKGFVNNSTVVQTNVNIKEPPQWISDESELYNVIRMDGAVQEVQTKESGQIGVTSGYTTSSIQLNFEPIAVQLLLDSSNPPTTERTLGVVNATTSYDYYVDRTKKQIIFNTSEYTPSSSDYAIVNYVYSRPTPVQVDDPDSIDTYGIKEITIKKSEIKEVDDAEVYATQYLEDHKNPILSAELKVTNIKDLDIGQQVRVIDTDQGIDDYFKIIKLKKEYPYRYDTIKVTSDILDETDYRYSISKRISELEKENQDDYDTLVQIKSFTEDIIIEESYLEIEKTDLQGDTLVFDNPINGILDSFYFDDPTQGFILGSSVYGVLGTNKLGVTNFTTYTDQIIHPGNRYIELFIDEDFKNASTTADWDTTNNQLEVTNGEEAISESFAIDLENDDVAFTNVKFTIEGTDLDNLTYYIGEYDNSSITYTEITTSGTSTSRSSEFLFLTNTNKYGINWKVTPKALSNPFPTPFGSWGKSNSGVITNLKIEYDVN